MAYMNALSPEVGVFITLRSFFSDVSVIGLKLVMVCSGVSLAANKMPPIVKVIDTIIIKGRISLTFEFFLSLLVMINFLSFIKHYKVLFSSEMNSKKNFPVGNFMLML